jgi:hypothetical protein
VPDHESSSRGIVRRGAVSSVADPRACVFERQWLRVGDIELRAPDRPEQVAPVNVVPQVHRRAILGGLINEYSKAA